MADLSDVLNAIASLVATIMYPNGAVDAQGNAVLSAAGVVVRIMRGTPFAKQLDDDVRAGIVNITVNERARVGRTTTRFPMEWMVSSVAVATLSSFVLLNTVTLGGLVTPGQGVLLIVDGQPYAYQVQANDILASVAAAFATTISLDRPASSSGAMLTVPGARRITVRNVLPGVAIRPTRQQTAGVMVKVFAPDFTTRDTVASLVDGSLATISRLALADGSTAMFRYSGTTYDDQSQKALSFIRTILYQAEYSTTQTMRETTIGVMEAVLTSGAPGGVPSNITLVTDVGPAISPLPSDLSVFVAGNQVSVDGFGNPEIEV